MYDSVVSDRISIYEQGIVNRSSKADVDLRNLDGLPKDLDMRENFGDTDLRPGEFLNGNYSLFTLRI